MENYKDEFANKVAIVTGAGQGMGNAVAERLAQGGSKIVVFLDCIFFISCSGCWCF